MKTKKWISMLLAMMMAMLVLAACGGNNATEESEGSNAGAGAETESVETDDDNAGNASADAGDVLIVYFSAANTKDADAVTGATPLIDDKGAMEWMADVIQSDVGGDMLSISPSTDYPLEYKECTDVALEEQKKNARPAFEPIDIDPTAYKTVFIGYPIWWGEIPMVLETFFETYDFSRATLVPFCTHEGSGESGTTAAIQDREPNATVIDAFAIRGGKTGTDDAKKEITDWLSGMNLK